MFEDSTFESTGKIRTRSRSLLLVAFAFNGSILLALIVFPLLYPEALPHRLADLLLTAPPAPTSPAPRLLRTSAQAFHGVAQIDAHPLVAPRIIPNTIAMVDRPEAGAEEHLLLMNDGAGSGVPGGNPFAGSTPAPRVVPAARPHGPVRISSGVAEGMLLKKCMPQYPAMARALHLGGTVQLQAVISKTGTVENVRVLSGPVLLQQASTDAVRCWRFRPYLLNGEPVDVETNVAVIFLPDRP